MTGSWFDRLEGDARDDWRHVTSHFHHHGNTIAVNQPQPHQEPVMPLADTSASLKDNSGQIRIGLQDGLAKLHDVLDNHMAQLDAAIGDVAAVASIADNPLVAAAAGALHVPPDVLDGFAKALSALAAAYPKPEAPVAPAVPAEPAQEAA